MKYYLTYRITPHPEGIEQGGIPEGEGGCDAILLGSLLYPEDGSYSAMFMAVDGRSGQPLSADEKFKAWVMLAYQLAGDPTLAPGKSGLCAQVFVSVREALLKVRDDQP